MFMAGKRLISCVLIPTFAVIFLASCWRPPPLRIYSTPPTILNDNLKGNGNISSSDDVLKSIYVVRKGDTAYRIARCYGVDLKALVKLNTMIAPYLIRVGQKIRIPTPIGSRGCSANVATNLEEQRDESTLSGADDVASNYIVSPPALTEKTPKKLEPPPARAGTKFLWPVKGTLVSKFGVKPGNLRNDGVNISAPVGSPVRAAENGVVAYAGNELRGYGNMLLVRHEGGWVTAYAHNSELLVARGAIVTRGEIIAKVGKSGNVNKPQTHFELRRGDEAIDPSKHLSWQ